MPELMSASEARNKIDSIISVEDIQLKETVTRIITQYIYDGKDRIGLDIPCEKYGKFKEWLESLGYTVNYGISREYGNWFSVYW